ncbi:hypothetical protein B0H14DRAFT_2558120 [Mycena olivaceomarginata]|nr:hypothetical protein B0H14DRAFT_2558120 [Mycena olivaceomarginata]
MPPGGVGLPLDILILTKNVKTLGTFYLSPSLWKWNIDTSPGSMACFTTGANACAKTVEINPNSPAVPPCSNCRLLATLKGFKTAISREATDLLNLKCMLFAKFKGLEALLAECPLVRSPNQYNVWVYKVREGDPRQGVIDLWIMSLFP